MKGLPDAMYIRLRERFTEKAIDEALQSLFKQMCIPILSQIGFKPEFIASRKFTVSEVQRIIISSIREGQAFRKEIKTKNHKQYLSPDDAKQLILEGVRKYMEDRKKLPQN
jgi:hypothetical protein